ncbi:cytochrome P450 [Halenospora varia]|nr:cytochrome P450 [Halenospora varia]
MAFSDAFAVLLDGYTPSILLAVAAVLLICWQRLAVSMDPREPPLLKPKVPYIGHILGLIKYTTSYFNVLNAKYHMPIATLPMINSKVYAINDPTLIHSALRSKNLSFEPFMTDFAQRMLALPDAIMVPIRDPGDEKSGLLTGLIKEIHTSMIGVHLHKMNADVLNDVKTSINAIGESIEVKSLYLWLRSTMTIATCNTLLGLHNPMRGDPSLVDTLWDFEGGMMTLLVGIFPSYFAPKAYQGRKVLQKILGEYYSAKHDLEPDVARITKVRAATYRRFGIPDEDIGRLELALLHVSTSNAIPSLFWNLVYVGSSPTLTNEIREELVGTITTTETSSGKEVSINISKFSTDCPLLVSAYRETIRLANAQLGTRRVMADTTISDGKKSYLLKKGADVQMPAGVTHNEPSTWGPDVKSFNARRFLAPEDWDSKTEEEKEGDRMQKKAYIPFGGGKHLCPGRNFAFAEILGMVSVLVLGFDIQGTDGKALKIPTMVRGGFADGVCKPVGEGAAMGARFVRREGWENVVFKFTRDVEVVTGDE